MGPDAMILVFWMLSLSQLFHYPLSLSSRDSLVLHFMPWGCCHLSYLRLLIFLLAILILGGASSSPAFCMMHSAYKLNKQGDNIQPWHTPFPIWNQSVSQCSVITVASWPAYRFLGRQVRWSGIPISLRIHTVKGFGIINKAEVDVFLVLSCFYDHPTDVGNLISGSSAFSKSSLNNWKFTVHVLVKTCLENFEHYFAILWDECNCMTVWTLFGFAFP